LVLDLDKRVPFLINRPTDRVAFVALSGTARAISSKVRNARFPASEQPELALRGKMTLNTQELRWPFV
jgi:hypothetical protein